MPALLQGNGDAEFRAHYPGCPECSGEVAVWRELDGMLRAGAPATDGHPPVDALLAFVDTPATLATRARADVERHLGSCQMCADEVATLRRVDLARLVSEPDRNAPSHGRLARLVWHPAFAYALVAVLLVPVLRDQVTRFSAPERTLPPRQDAAPAEKRERVAPVANEQAAGRRVAPPAGAMLKRAEPEAPRPADRLEADGAPSLQDLAATTALAERAQPGASSDAEPVLALAAGGHATIALADAERGPLVRLAAPAGADDAPLELRIRGKAGRELVERVAVRANAIEVRIPPHWLTPGDYVVTLAPPADGRVAAAAQDGARERVAIVLGFTVRGPIAAR